MRPAFVTLAFVALVMALASSALRASTMGPMSLDELVAAAEHIVVATVVSTRATWDADHRRIHSTIAIDVEETWKGNLPAHRRVTIVQPGGTVGDIEMTVIGMPRFASGERSLLFLSGSNHVQVVGMAQGKRSLHWDSAQRRWLAMPVGGDSDLGTIGSREPGSSLATPLPDLHRRVEALMARQ